VSAACRNLRTLTQSEAADVIQVDGYKDILSDQERADLLAYLKTL
jgi:hypothetical protein